MANDFEHLFMCIICHLSIFLGEVSVSFDHFFIDFCLSLLSFADSLYIVDTSPLSDLWFADIFCKTVTCLFILLTGSFLEQILLILMKFN